MSSHCCNCSMPNLIVFFFSKTIICEPTASRGLLLWALHPLPVPAPGAREVARGSPLHPHPVGEDAVPTENPTPQESAAGVPGDVLPLLPGSSGDVYSRYSFPLHEMIPATFNKVFSIRCLIGKLCLYINVYSWLPEKKSIYHILIDLCMCRCNVQYLWSYTCGFVSCLTCGSFIICNEWLHILWINHICYVHVVLSIFIWNKIKRIYLLKYYNLFHFYSVLCVCCFKEIKLLSRRIFAELAYQSLG